MIEWIDTYGRFAIAGFAVLCAVVLVGIGVGMFNARRRALEEYRKETEAKTEVETESE